MFSGNTVQTGYPNLKSNMMNVMQPNNGKAKGWKARKIREELIFIFTLLGYLMTTQVEMSRCLCSCR